MSVVGIERKQIAFSLPITGYQSLKRLADLEGLSVHQYSRRLMEREIYSKGLPLYWPGDNKKEKA